MSSTTFLESAGPVLDGAIWQGIEYLTADFGVPGFAAVVTAHLARPASGLGIDDVTVDGGVSLTDLPFEVLLNNGDPFFVVRFPEKGDRAPYLVGLSSGGNDPLHPFFSAADFTFFIDCPAGDCRDPALLPSREPRPGPAVDTLHKDYRGFLQTLAEWVRVRNPHWADLSEASLEKVLIDLLAHQGDHLSYYQDRVANEAFIETASQRYSLEQHATLLGYRPFNGSAASTLLSFHVQNSGFVPAGLVVRQPRVAGEATPVFSTTRRVAVRPENNWDQLRVAAWPGAFAAKLPEGATELLLWQQTTRLEEGQRLAFVQGPFSQIVTIERVEGISEPGWTQDPADPPHANPSPLTRVRWREPLARDLFPWQGEPALMIGSNLVDAVHGELKTAWLDPATAPPAGDQIVSLDRRNSIVVRRPLGDGERGQLRALRLPASPVLHDDGRPAVELRVDGDPWRRVETLIASRSFDLDYTTGADSDGSLWLHFGDGEHGRDVPRVTSPASRPAAAPNGLAIEAATIGSWGNRIAVTFAESSDGDVTRFRIAVFYTPTNLPAAQLVEDFDRLSANPLDPRYVLDLLRGSDYIRGSVAEPPLAAAPAPEPGLGPLPNLVPELLANSVALVGDPEVELEIRYRVGDPLVGNCALETLTEIVPPRAGTTTEAELQQLGQVAVTNPTPGAGGRAAESNDALRLAIPDSLRHGRRQRAVALEDYAEAAVESDRRVARAAARAIGGPFNAVLVLVDPVGQTKLEDDLRRAVFDHLDRLRMAGREHWVQGPDYVPLDVELVVCPGPGFLPHEVRRRVLTELRPGTDERRGYFHPDRLSFGEDVTLGDLIAFVQGVAGVHSVKATRFRRLHEPATLAVADRVDLGLTEVARLDGDENFPENGVLKVRVVGLDPVDVSLFALDGPAGASP